jgi:hypothetical protein
VSWKRTASRPFRDRVMSPGAGTDSGTETRERDPAPGTGYPQKSSGHLCAPKSMRFRFMADHRDKFPVVRMSKVLGVSRSEYYAWRERPVSAREMANRELYKKIEAVHNENHGTAPLTSRVWAAARIGWRV